MPRLQGYAPLPTSDEPTAMPRHTTTSARNEDSVTLFPTSTIPSHDPRAAMPVRKRPRLLLSPTRVCYLLGVLAISYLLIKWLLPDHAALALGIFGAKTMQQGETPFPPLPTGPEPASLNASYSGDEWEAAAHLLEEAEELDEVELWEELEVLDDSHVLRRVTPLRAPPRLLKPISRLPHSILMSFYTAGTIPSFLVPAEIPRPQPIDLLYLYVDATSSIFHTALDSRALSEGLQSLRGKARRWRDNGELRGAVRSATTALGSQLGTVHVISADLPLTDAGRWRAGQIPKWLNPDSRDGGMKWHFHSDIFRLPRDDDGSLPRALVDTEWEDEETWRNATLPSFNSFAIEERVAWVNGLREEMVMSNDDMFMLNPLSGTDFHHPLMGPALRLDPTPGLLVNPHVPGNLLSSSGEWGGLQHANLLISGRFAARPRMYMHHLPRAVRKSLVDEASVMFARQLTVASTRGFRESKRGRADVEMSWLVSHLGIERWREALLWSFVVAKIGGTNGFWDATSRTQMREVLGLADEDPRIQVVVQRAARTTLDDMAGVVEQAGWEAPKHTANLWSSFDGHLPRRPDFPDADEKACMFAIDTCLPDGFFSKPHIYHFAHQIFTKLAFARPECGDCLIAALVNSSGSRGLSAFLPSEEQLYYPEDTKKGEWERTEPMLPLSDRWADANFSISNNVRKGQDLWDGVEVREDGAVRLREWCVKLLSRYVYSYGSTVSKFIQIHSARELTNALKLIDKNQNISLLCVNDDQPDTAPLGVADKLAEWMSTRWGGVETSWERANFPWRISKANSKMVQRPKPGKIYP